VRHHQTGAAKKPLAMNPPSLIVFSYLTIFATGSPKSRRHGSHRLRTNVLSGACCRPVEGLMWPATLLQSGGGMGVSVPSVPFWLS